MSSFLLWAGIALAGQNTRAGSKGADPESEVEAVLDCAEMQGGRDKCSGTRSASAAYVMVTLPEDPTVKVICTFQPESDDLATVPVGLSSRTLTWLPVEHVRQKTLVLPSTWEGWTVKCNAEDRVEKLRASVGSECNVRTQYRIEISSSEATVLSKGSDVAPVSPVESCDDKGTISTRVWTVQVKLGGLPTLQEARAHVQGSGGSGTQRSLSSPVPALASDTLDILTEIVVSKAKDGAFDILSERLETWTCEDATLTADLALPSVLEPLRGRQLLPNTCRVVRGLTLPALANASQALTLAIRSDAMNAGLEYAFVLLGSDAVSLPFDSVMADALVSQAQILGRQDRKLKGLPDATASLAQRSVEALRRGGTLDPVYSSLDRLISVASRVSGPEMESLQVALLSSGPQPSGRVKRIVDARDRAIALGDEQSSLASRVLAVAETWTAAVLTLEVVASTLEGQEDYGPVDLREIAKVSEALDKLETAIHLPGGGSRRRLEALVELHRDWFTEEGARAITTLASRVTTDFAPQLAAARIDGQWSDVVKGLNIVFAPDNLPGRAEPLYRTWRCALDLVSGNAPMAPAEVERLWASASFEWPSSSCDAPRKAEAISLARLYHRLVTTVEVDADARAIAATQLLAWSLAAKIEGTPAWFVPAHAVDAQRLALTIRTTVASGVLVEGSPLHETLERLAPTLREIAANPAGFDVSDAQLVLANLSSVDWSRTYGPRPETCAVDLGLAVTGICEVLGGCEASQVIEMLQRPGEYITLDECSVHLEGVLDRRPELPSLVTDALHLLNPGSQDGRTQVRASIDLGFAVMNLLVGPRGEDPRPQRYLETLHRLSLGLVDEDMAAVATSGTELLLLAFDELERTQGEQASLVHLREVVQRAGPLVTTLASNARSLQQAAMNPGDAAALREARKQALSDLIEASTRRENRDGEWIGSFGSPVGPKINLVGSSTLGALIPTGSEAGSGADTAQEQPWTNALGLSLPLGLGVQHMPLQQRPEDVSVVDWRRMAYPSSSRLLARPSWHFFFGMIDLGQFLSTNTAASTSGTGTSEDESTVDESASEGAALQWGDIVVLDVQVGLLCRLGKKPSDSLILALDARVLPGGERAGEWSAGLTVGYYVPIFDLN